MAISRIKATIVKKKTYVKVMLRYDIYIGVSREN